VALPIPYTPVTMAIKDACGSLTAMRVFVKFKEIARDINFCSFLIIK